ncbi:XdhC family protein [Leeuwenhoekiella sp. W20_SRS_FM14]|uniref:XdhC family protein n=1 Tax=Leeuwenhoekiella sp. W20_SRS_FM14 TaxID=3240270 RepID=UPI003F94F918
MTHEFKKIVENAFAYYTKGISCVLATVVHLKGSSYRKPGVSMLIAQDGTMTGAVSGGCVEKEVLFQAASVFENHQPKMMTYDGRYRLGCEGILYILIEPFVVNETIFKSLASEFERRTPFKIASQYSLDIENPIPGLGSEILLSNGDKIKTYSEPENFKPENEEALLFFQQELSALFQLFLFGAEHDAVQLGQLASLMGWEVTVIASVKDQKALQHFPGVTNLLHISPEESQTLSIDENSAVVLMNHNYATDLNFLLHILEKNPVYIGSLGSVKRREKLFNDLIEFRPDKADLFIDKIYGPAGLDIGAITPQEIANSIISEITAVVRKKEIKSLRDIPGSIHA